MQIRPATASDIRAFHDGALPATARAVAVERDGEVLGVGGVYYADGAVIAFTVAAPGLSKQDRVRAGRLAFEVVKSVKAPVWAIQGDEATSPTVLRHFGFAPVDGRFWVRWP